jgi:CheY-like chemotaxis protein
MNEKYKNVLVIDDEEEIVNAAKRMLERSGFSVFTALNGKQGMELISRNVPDVIITDIIMPVMDGYEFYKTLKNEAQTARIPVIILTARPNMEDAFKALGVQGFVTKPFTGESLINKISQLSDKDTPARVRESILASGSDEYTVNHMAILLKDEGYNVRSADNWHELLVNAIETTPDYIFLDVNMTDLPSREIIKALRSFHKLDNTRIVLYTKFVADENHNSTFSHVDFLQEAKEACMRAGANYYIGRFSSVNFIDLFNNIKNAN